MYRNIESTSYIRTEKPPPLFYIDPTKYAPTKEQKNLSMAFPLPSLGMVLPKFPLREWTKQTHTVVSANRIFIHPGLGGELMPD